MNKKAILIHADGMRPDAFTGCKIPSDLEGKLLSHK